MQTQTTRSTNWISKGFSLALVAVASGCGPTQATGDSDPAEIRTPSASSTAASPFSVTTDGPAATSAGSTTGSFRAMGAGATTGSVAAAGPTTGNAAGGSGGSDTAESSSSNGSGAGAVASGTSGVTVTSSASASSNGSSGSTASPSSAGSTGGTTAASSPTLTCPGTGAYCGNDGVLNGDASTLYQCPGAGSAPTSSAPCAQGCSVQPDGTPDFCVSTGPICPGAGSYCGSDGVQNGEGNTLYTCPGAGQAPSVATACAQGCQVKPSGTPDLCTPTTPVCPGAGSYCGSDGVQNGDDNTLYECPAVGAAPSSSSACAAGCQVNPSGVPDSCQVTCPGAGSYCGSDGVQGGAANTLYQCSGAGAAPSSSTPCAQGCNVQPAGTPDYCTGGCGGAIGNALSWQTQKINAGEGGDCSGSPPSCYSDWCLAFVNDALVAAGFSGMYANTAAEAMANQQSSGNWTAWNGSCPCGAVLFWGANSCNGGDGHVVICNGDGTVSTSGWSGFTGSASASISWLVGEECGNAPAGYATP